MQLKGMVLVGLVAGSALVAGCVGSPTKQDTVDDRSGFVACQEPRPEICTMDYNPVCGKRSDGTVKTYSNGCSACSDPKVVAYRSGPCNE